MIIITITVSICLKRWEGGNKGRKRGEAQNKKNVPTERMYRRTDGEGNVFLPLCTPNNTCRGKVESTRHHHCYHSLYLSQKVARGQQAQEERRRAKQEHESEGEGGVFLQIRFLTVSSPKSTSRGIVVRPPRFHSSNVTVPSLS